MIKLNLRLDFQNPIGTATKMLYGGLVEHLGRCVYGGVYDPADPQADEEGFRKDVMATMRELKIAVARYPGGCFTDLWCWEDGVGPHRKARLDPAWKQLEPNTFGLHEFVHWCRKCEIEPMVTLNLSLRDALDAARLVEYCNFPGGTELSEQRKANGDSNPFGIKYFCLGNELYAPWEFGQCPPETYAVRARECAKVIKAISPDAKCLLCGCGYDNDWNRKVLEICYDHVDALSLHFGFGSNDPDEAFYHTLYVHEKTLRECADIIEAIRQSRKSERRVGIAIDEWIIWNGDDKAKGSLPYTVGMHLLEEDYSIREVLLCGAFLSRFLHGHCDCVDLACVAQLVNVIAPVRTAPGGVLWRQGNFYPMAYAARYGCGKSLRLSDLPQDLQASAILAENGELAVFVTNLHKEPCNMNLELGGGVAKGLLEAVTLHCEDEKAFNTPERSPLCPQKLTEAALTAKGDSVMATLPAHSWSCIRLNTQLAL